MADRVASDGLGAEVYPLVDYHRVQAARSNPRPPDPAPGALADSDTEFVVIDHRATDVQDHYLNSEDLVAAGLLGPEHDPEAERARPLPPPRRRHRVRSTLLAIFAILVLVVVVAVFHVRGQITPGGKPGAVVSVVIPPQSSTASIGSILAKAGVIHGGGLFAYYVKVQGAGPLLAGTYRLAKNESYGRVSAVLAAGPPKVYDRLTIPEGYTLADIAQRVAALPGMHLSAAKFLAASANGTVRSPFEPPGVNNLEGLVFPATYDISTTMSEVDVLEKMVGAFNGEAQVLNLNQNATALHMTPYDLVKVASIVEREAKLDPDRGPVASAIDNRLTASMTLGADSTLVYALRLANPKVEVATIDYNQANPYNTRINKGLPPTPIANAGLPSLRAAAQPPKTNYLYFVEINPNGQLGFASTNAGFQGLETQCKAVKLC